MADGGDDMRALMGFASFGRPRKRLRRQNKHTQSTHGPSRDDDGAHHPHQRQEGVEDDDEEEGELAHVVPGTMVHPTVQTSNLRISPRGIALLIKPTDQNAVDIAALLSLSDAPVTPQETHHELWKLPPSSMELLDALNATKASFETIDHPVFALARRRANPYEAIGRDRFINRSAMKMANLDFLFQWTQQHQKTTSTPFVFADVCGGPGGFSEYFLWKMNTHSGHPTNSQAPQVVGFGISLRGAEWCDWKLAQDEQEQKEEDQAAGVSQASRFHICDGADGTGDLYKIENIHNFRDTLRRAYADGAHIVVADGGFRDARNQRNQELVVARLIIAETLTMFSVLRVGGSFVCKVFELSTPLMLQVTWLIHQCFDEFTIVKPVTSRPASSERYVVAQRMHAQLPLAAIIARLETLVTSLEHGDPQHEQLFPTKAPSQAFLDFVAQANDRHARQQIEACEDILAFANHTLPPKKRRHVSSIDAARYYHAWGLL